MVAGIDGLPHLLQHFAGARAVSAGNQGAAFANHLLDGGQDLPAFVVGQGVVLTGRAQRYETVHTGRQLMFEDRSQGVVIDFAGGVERGDQGGQDAIQFHRVTLLGEGGISRHSDEAGAPRPHRPGG